MPIKNVQERLRRIAVRATSCKYPSIAEAVEALGFVQIDPIQAPARAQDLILRHRVPGYRAGDMDAAYPELALEEDLLYAHGYVTRETWSLLHPRVVPAPSPLEREVHALLEREGPLDAHGVSERIPSDPVRNAWGGRSKATQLALERLHRAGRARIAGRASGRRIYGVATPPEAAPIEQRLRALALVAAKSLAPVRERRLRADISRMGARFGHPRRGAEIVDALVTEGALTRAEFENEGYLWPPGITELAPPRNVALLAPFDPLVHDRERLSQLFGFDYRFEAYTPAAERVRGYYALPVRYGTVFVGHANLTLAEGELEVRLSLERDVGPRALFRRQLDAELRTFQSFLGAERVRVAL